MDENNMQTWTLYGPASGDPVIDFNGSGSLTMRYLWGPTGVVARPTSGGTVSWYLADALGAVRDLINNRVPENYRGHAGWAVFSVLWSEWCPTRLI
jgi:hypothetical protein